MIFLLSKGKGIFATGFKIVTANKREAYIATKEENKWH
jgi:hypothetical protein